MADDERLDAGDAVVCRRRHQREPTDHYAFDYEVELAQRRCRALSLQKLEVVSVKRLTALRVAFFDRLRDRLTHRASPTAIRVLPGQAIMLSRRAGEALRILIDSGIIVNLRGVFLLCLHVSPANLDGVQFVGSNAPAENLIVAGLGIEVPLAPYLHDRNRQRPTLIPNYQCSAGRVRRARGHGSLLA